MLKEIQIAFEIAQFAYEKAKALIEAAKANGDPIPEDVLAQVARTKAALDEIAAIANGTA